MNIDLELTNLMSFYKEYKTNPDLSLDDYRLKSIPSMVNYYAYILDKPIGDHLLLMENIINVLSMVYNNGGKRLVSDYDYDSLYERYTSYTTKEVIGADNLSNVKTASHDYPDLRGTLTKIYSIHKGEIYKTGIKEPKKSLEDWIESVENMLGRPLTSDECTCSLEPKFDGISVEFSCDKDGKVYKALTRGNVDTNVAQDITSAFGDLSFPEYRRDRKFGLKSEVIMPIKAFEEVAEKYGFKTPLSATSGILNSDSYDPEMIKYLEIVPLRIQEEGSDDILGVPNIYEQNYMCKINDFNSIREIFDEIKNNMEGRYPIDGVVIILDNWDIRTKLGRKDHKSMYEVAYKFPPEEKESIIHTVVWQYGLLGNITPVAKIEPVKMKGKTISSISLGSKDRFLSLDLHEGDKVFIQYEVIPYLDKVPNQEHIGPKFEIPTVCGICGHDIDLDRFTCSNINCESKVKGKILNYIIKMDIENISDSTLEVLYDNGFLRSIVDLYKLRDHYHQIIQLPRFGEKSLENIIKSIDDHRSVTMSKLIGSIGIKGVGRRIMETILRVYDYESLMNNVVYTHNHNRLVVIDGIGEITAKAIIHGLEENGKLIEELLKYVDIVDEAIPDDKEYDTIVYFTKVRDPEFSEFLEKNGILVSDKFNKKVDYLIIKDDSSDSKKIGKYDIPVLTLEEAYKKFNYGI